MEDIKDKQKKAIDKVNKDLKKFQEEQTQKDVITNKAINQILNITLEDWRGTTKAIDYDKVVLQVDDFIYEGKRYNLKSFLDELNKEETELFIQLMLHETRRLLDIVDLEELKKLKLDYPR